MKKINVTFLGYKYNENALINPNTPNWYSDNIFLFLLKKHLYRLLILNMKVNF